jgi:hypothetical protein
VVAFAPAGGWDGGAFPPELLERQRGLLAAAKAIAPHAAAITATPEGRRRATQLIVGDPEGIPAELIAHLMLGVAACPRAADLLDRAGGIDWALDAARIECPVRVVWGTADRLLPWPAAATRFRRDWLPHADWVELEGVGHCPQLDVPLEAAQLVLGRDGLGGRRRARGLGVRIDDVAGEAPEAHEEGDAEQDRSAADEPHRRVALRRPERTVHTSIAIAASSGPIAVPIPRLRL